MDVSYGWRAPFASADVNALHAEGFGHPVLDIDWQHQVERHSLGWVCATDAGRLVGFVNVAWDGGVHAFVIDTVVANGSQGLGIGSGLIDTAAHESRSAGCEWLHVDFDEELRGFYLESCGFSPAPAGVMALPRVASGPEASSRPPGPPLEVEAMDGTAQGSAGSEFPESI